MNYADGLVALRGQPASLPLYSICLRAIFYPRYDLRSNFHGPVSDGLILRALPPYLTRSGRWPGRRVHRSKKRNGGPLNAEKPGGTNPHMCPLGFAVQVEHHVFFNMKCKYEVQLRRR